jgi:hypothetical protein
MAARIQGSQPLEAQLDTLSPRATAADLWWEAINLDQGCRRISRTVLNLCRSTTMVSLGFMMPDILHGLPATLAESWHPIAQLFLL